jgi:hypothetical protein
MRDEGSEREGKNQSTFPALAFFSSSLTLLAVQLSFPVFLRALPFFSPTRRFLSLATHRNSSFHPPHPRRSQSEALIQPRKVSPSPLSPSPLPETRIKRSNISRSNTKPEHGREAKGRAAFWCLAREARKRYCTTGDESAHLRLDEEDVFSRRESKFDDYRSERVSSRGRSRKGRK